MALKKTIGKFKINDSKTFYLTDEIFPTSIIDKSMVSSITSSLPIISDITHQIIGYEYIIYNVSQSEDDLGDIISGSKVSQSFDCFSFEEQFEEKDFSPSVIRYFNTTGSIEQSVYHVFGESEIVSTGSKSTDKELRLTISDSLIVKKQNI
tara:strand:- start:81 stop:533 length:453 start_codon:yes stop_codon:yes gene_type:complete